MLTLPFNTGVTFGELARDPAVQRAWDAYAANSERPHTRWLDHCRAARAYLESSELSAMPAAKHLVGMAVVHELAVASDGLSGAHLENVCREAALAGLRADISCSTLPEKQLRDALKTLYHRSTSKPDLLK